MNVSKAFRMLILVFSFIMFLWQARIAVIQLMDPPVVDSTERLSIADIEPLLITICPLEQWNIVKRNELGYMHNIFLLMGIGNDLRFQGWGAQHNLTYEELIGKVTNFNLRNSSWKVMRDNKPINFSCEIRFYPKHGFCYDLVNLTTVGRIKIWTLDPEFKNAKVYITDKKMRTRNTIFTQSNWGKIILFQGLKEYVIKTEKLSNFDPRNPDDCKEYENDDYEKCVDDELQKVFKPLINCNPPWLSSKDQCDSVDGIKENFTSMHEMYETVSGIYEMSKYPAMEKCTKPCTVTDTIIYR